MSDYNTRAETAVMERRGKLSGHEIKFLCPSHDDTNPSAFYNPAKGLWKCFVCNAHGNAYQLLKLLGKENGQFSNQWSITPIITKKRIDRPGQKKSYIFETNGEAGLKNVKVTTLPLYNYQDIQPDNTPILVSEGEKASESGIIIGFVSVGTVTGAGATPSRESLHPLASHTGEVYLIPDNDDPGRKHMNEIAARLKAMGKIANILVLPVKEKGDLTDFVLGGGNQETLTLLFPKALPYEGDAEIETTLDDTLHDIGNAKRFVKQHGHKLRYNYDRNLWLIYTGKFWEWDDGSNITKLAAITARSIYHEAGDEADKDRQSALVKHAKVSQSNMRIKAMMELARAELAVKITNLNSNQYYLNCKNGTVNLKTNQLQPHDPDDLITCYIPTEYDADAKSELFTTFLNKIFEDNQNIITYVQKCLGYSVTGDQREQALWFNKGSGFNGKSTLYGAVLDILADYAGEIDPIAFSVDKNAHAGPNEALASLYGKRFVISVEIKNAMRLNVSLIKRMTGGESIRCERKFEHGFNFQPTHKLWILANSDPRIDDDTNSIYFRLKYLSFNVTVPECDRDRQLRDKLAKNEGKAILAWVVEGCRLWQSEGIKDPQEVKDAVATYRDSQDTLHDYLEENCVAGNMETCTVSDLYNDYFKWANNNHFEPLGKILFGGKLKDKGYKTFKGNSNKKFWRGIRPVSSLDKGLLTHQDIRTDELKTEEVTPEVTFVSINRGSSQDNSSCIETSEKIGNKTNKDNKDNESNQLGFLPDCNLCGCNEWAMNESGKFVCSCGNILEGN